MSTDTHTHTVCSPSCWHAIISVEAFSGISGIKILLVIISSFFVSWEIAYSFFFSPAAICGQKMLIFFMSSWEQCINLSILTNITPKRNHATGRFCGCPTLFTLHEEEQGWMDGEEAELSCLFWSPESHFASPSDLLDFFLGTHLSECFKGTSSDIYAESLVNRSDFIGWRLSLSLGWLL